MKSIRKRILVALFVSQGLLTIVCVASAVQYIQKQRVAAFDAEILRKIGSLVSSIQLSDTNPREVVVSLQAEMLPANDLYVIRDGEGVILGSSRHARGFLEQRVSAAGDVDFEARGGHYRGKVARHIPIVDPDEEKPDAPAPEVDIWYAVDAGTFDMASRRIAWLATLGGLFWIGSSCFIAWVAVTKGMLPLGQLAEQASAITERSWDLSLPPEVRDVAETRPLALALEGLVGRLSAAFERERTFLSDAAHELKTVVAIQKSSLQVVLQGGGTEAEFRSGLERALDDVDRLNSLVHRMLYLASIESWEGEREQRVIRVDDTILAACEQLGPIAAACQVTVATGTVHRCDVVSEEGLLQTLWVAILENAIRYSPSGSIVTIACEVDHGSAVIIVRDQGAGIDPRALPHIFERFYRADPSRSRESGGFGLGLAIAKAIAEKHRGRIKVDSVVGAGTSVRVNLPTVEIRHG